MRSLKISTMAYFKNFFSTPTSFTRNSIFLVSLLLLSVLLLLSSFQSKHSPTVVASTIASRLLFAANYYISPFSAVSASNTCLISDSESNCTLPTVAAVEISHVYSRKHRENYDAVKNLSSCDFFDGDWVVDSSDPLYPPGSCPYIDDAFNCFKNGRPDLGYLRYRWKPRGCRIPRFDGRKMLEMLRGKRLVFVGDSLNRNMWQSLICALRQSLKNKSRVYEVSGRRSFTTQGFHSVKFRDYKCSIDFVKSPFLVQEWKISDEKGSKRDTLRLDMIQGSSSSYHDADIIIFNTGHWWTHHKTYKGNYYFQEGSHVYKNLEVREAYTKAIRTWAKWVDSNIDSRRTKVFFRGYSASHFRKGDWNTGGRCDGERQPMMNKPYKLRYPWMMKVLESVMAEMKTPVLYFNITDMTNFRKDGHPSIYRQPEIRRNPGMIQDCSHWCLPGVPDSWNELLYATLLLSHHDLPSK